jgi:hypothetical protein
MIASSLFFCLLRKSFVADHYEIFIPSERGTQRSLHHFEANRSFLQNVGTLLKHKMFLAREVGTKFRQDPSQSHHAGKGETDTFE